MARALTIESSLPILCYNFDVSNRDDNLIEELNRRPPTDSSGDVDLEQLLYNLSLSPGERLRQNDRWAEFVGQLREAGREFYEDEAST